MKRTDLLNTITYDFDNGFRVDIVDDKEEDLFIAWLYHKDYPVKSLMLGLPKKRPIEDGEMTLEQCVKIVEDNLLNESFIEDYIEEFMDYVVV